MRNAGALLARPTPDRPGPGPMAEGLLRALDISIGRRVEGLLARAGYETLPVQDAHLCCGSAGTYSLLQPAISAELRRRKLDALQAGKPALLATANIGCLTHLQAESTVPVRHWIELVDEALERRLSA